MTNPHPPKKPQNFEPKHIAIQGKIQAHIVLRYLMPYPSVTPWWCFWKKKPTFKTVVKNVNFPRSLVNTQKLPYCFEELVYNRCPTFTVKSLSLTHPQYLAKSEPEFNYCIEMKLLSSLRSCYVDNLFQLKLDASFECMEWTEFLILPGTVGESKIKTDHRLFRPLTQLEGTSPPWLLSSLMDISFNFQIPSSKAIWILLWGMQVMVCPLCVVLWWIYWAGTSSSKTE